MVVSSQYRDRETFMAHLELYIILEPENMMQYFITEPMDGHILCETLPQKNVKLEELYSWTWFFL
jgi:hypothetical protein